MSTASSSTSTTSFDATRLLHSNYDFASSSPQTSIKIMNTAETFMKLVRENQISPDLIPKFITFIDDDRVFPLCPTTVPELRYHPSESKAPGGNGYMDGDLNNEGVARILSGIAHRLPAAPGEEAPTTAAQKAFQEEYKEVFEEMDAAAAAREKEEMKEYFEKNGENAELPPLPNTLVLQVRPVTTFGELMKSMKENMKKMKESKE